MINYDYELFNLIKKSFEENSFVHIREVLKPELTDYLHHLSYFTAMREIDINKYKFKENDTHAVVKANKQNHLDGFSLPISESLLVLLTPLYRSLTGKNLQPTYSFFRAYEKGDTLTVHKDRKSCQYSATIQVGSTDPSYVWPFEVSYDNVNNTSISASTGDVIFYKGEDLWHGRKTPLDIEQSAHVFCHWVDVDEPGYAQYKFDGRRSLGLPS